MLYATTSFILSLLFLQCLQTHKEFLPLVWAATRRENLKMSFWCCFPLRPRKYISVHTSRFEIPFGFWWDRRIVDVDMFRFYHHRLDLKSSSSVPFRSEPLSRWCWWCAFPCTLLLFSISRSSNSRRKGESYIVHKRSCLFSVTSTSLDTENLEKADASLLIMQFT